MKSSDPTPIPTLCPCGSQKNFTSCCGPYVQRKEQPETAEALMRSRYVAYVVKDALYLIETLLPKQRKAGLEKDIRDWMKQVEWLGLSVIRTAKGQKEDQSGEVEFIAEFSANGKIDQQHEISAFKKVKHRWFYVDGLEI